MSLEPVGRNMRVRTKSHLWNYIKRNLDLYLLLVPGLMFLLIFKYLPLAANVIAFKDFNIFVGDNLFDSIIRSPWVGFDNFARAFNRPGFISAFSNTVIISFMKIIFITPIPVIIAILLNEAKNVLIKRSVQTILYFPYFVSWTVVGALFMSIFKNNGIVSNLLGSIGFGHPKFFMDNSLFRWLLVITELWKETGWVSIIYLASIATIDPQLYEAATVDGAGRFHKILHITLPSLSSIIAMLFVLRVGWMLKAGFEQVFVMYNPSVYESGDILTTFVYRIGLGQLDFSFASAMGLFNSIFGFLLIIISNAICKRVFDTSIW